MQHDRVYLAGYFGDEVGGVGDWCPWMAQFVWIACCVFRQLTCQDSEMFDWQTFGVGSSERGRQIKLNEIDAFPIVLVLRLVPHGLNSFSVSIQA